MQPIGAARNGGARVAREAAAGQASGPPPTRRVAHALFASALPLLASCGTGVGAPSGPLESTTEMVGDTTVVRTLSGSVWGAPARLVEELSIGVLDGDPAYMFGQVIGLTIGPDGAIYVLDRQSTNVRVFGADGVHLRTIGRSGQGPGELRQPDGGLAVLADGRVLVRDPGNARIQVYAADGTPAGQWQHRGGFFTSNPLWVDREQNVYTQILIDNDVGTDPNEWRMALQRIAPDGVYLQELRVPTAAYAAATLEARAQGGSSRMTVPFTPSESWAFHPDGYFVHGLSDAYHFSLLRPDAPLRIERADAPVRVTAGERTEESSRVTRSLRGVDPAWQWNGPDIPATKPPYRSLHVGRDGRIWVMLSQPGVEADDPFYDPTTPNAVEDRWKEPLAFDVFEPDGRYLGQVSGPTGLGMFVFEGDKVWAVMRDAMGVQRVVRYRIETP